MPQQQVPQQQVPQQQVPQQEPASLESGESCLAKELLSVRNIAPLEAGGAPTMIPRLENIEQDENDPRVEWDEERRPWVVCGAKRRKLSRQASGGCDDWQVTHKDGEFVVVSAQGHGPSYSVDGMFAETQQHACLDNDWLQQMAPPAEVPPPAALMLMSRDDTSLGDGPEELQTVASVEE